ncbi:hypothetical protein DSO57_1035706 [Entomophthora muscae]|uniref:Uncharacterized protein n=1 Tax=Entomophthora muscae TaxID=34485 RepID=A0ACC2TAH7_9FUNG|nr:hypothetical protein DSO57_1035706 [Entomophthora muscae]
MGPIFYLGDNYLRLLHACDCSCRVQACQEPANPDKRANECEYDRIESLAIHWSCQNFNPASVSLDLDC